MTSVHLQHMQKALDQMNLQIHHVISDLTGTAGLAIIDSILAGERDPKKLAGLRDWRIRATEETIIKSLVGDYRDEHLFTLRQSLVAYRHYQQLIAEVDAKIKHLLCALPAQVDPAERPLPAARNPRKSPSRTGPTKNRAAVALRMAAQALHHSQTFLGEYYRRMRARLGAPKAITACGDTLWNIAPGKRRPLRSKTSIPCPIRPRSAAGLAAWTLPSRRLPFCTKHSPASLIGWHLAITRNLNLCLG
jgi:hypothetical protein